MDGWFLWRRTKDETNDGGRLSFAFRLCTGRKPAAKELALLKGFLSRQTRRFSEDGAKPGVVLEVVLGSLAAHGLGKLF